MVNTEGFAYTVQRLTISQAAGGTAFIATIVQAVYSVLQYHQGRPRSKQNGITIGARAKAIADRTSRITIGAAGYWLLVLALLGIPIGRELGLLDWSGWFVAWLVLFMVKTYVDPWSKGAFVERALRNIADINLKSASTIDTLGTKLRGSHDQRLSEEASRALSIGILQRVHDYVERALSLRDETRIRTTLAVPVKTVTGATESLRVWCYNAPHEDRRWTELPLMSGGSPSPGAPAAYLSGKTQIIGDMHLLTDYPMARNRRFRSVLSIPIFVGGPNGKCLGVLSVDAEMPDVFAEERIERLVMPLLASSVNMLGLVLLLRREDATYAFGH